MKEIAGLHKLKVDNTSTGAPRPLFDAKRIYGIRKYSVVQKEGDNQATLTIEMDVTILGDSQADNSIDERCDR